MFFGWAAYCRRVLRTPCYKFTAISPLVSIGVLIPHSIVNLWIVPVSVAVHNAGNAPLGVVGELEALTSVRLGVVLVGPDQPHHLAVAVVDGALYPTVPLNAPDLPV